MTMSKCLLKMGDDGTYFFRPFQVIVDLCSGCGIDIADGECWAVAVSMYTLQGFVCSRNDLCY